MEPAYQNTTLCYLEQEGKYLLLHRVKKKNDVNKDKWIGVGGKLEPGESPEECALREIREETGLYANDLQPRGVVTFCSDSAPTEQMFLFTCTDFDGELSPCDEGELCWVDKKQVASLPIWQGDKIFLQLLQEDADFFFLKLCYRGDTLVEYTLRWGFTKHDEQEKLRREKLESRARRNAQRLP